MSEPLIYTSKGNLPVASLEYKHGWEDGPGEVIFSEEYRLDGELVRRDVHIMKKRGESIGAAQASFS